MQMTLKIATYCVWLICLLSLLLLTRNEFSWVLEEDPGAVLPGDPRESFKVGLAFAVLGVALACQARLAFTAGDRGGRLLAIVLAALTALAWARFYFGG
ncbi:hypothetical protein [Pelagibacterium xiamenense]|uniref:hypothetical protein n=1 Tax=Pelagibacterium xiamenense TaxID=2901140 RepID=UPI001E51658D|nr:hypothetical protein [Pelagibacterium xiamenense]MCD7061398.1 hypothetical protein [Pelagibacterium xiamenense]